MTTIPPTSTVLDSKLFLGPAHLPEGEGAKLKDSHAVRAAAAAAVAAVAAVAAGGKKGCGRAVST